MLNQHYNMQQWSKMGLSARRYILCIYITTMSQQCTIESLPLLLTIEWSLVCRIATVSLLRYDRHDGKKMSRPHMMNCIILCTHRRHGSLPLSQTMGWSLICRVAIVRCSESESERWGERCYCCSSQQRLTACRQC